MSLIYHRLKQVSVIKSTFNGKEVKPIAKAACVCYLTTRHLTKSRWTSSWRGLMKCMLNSSKKTGECCCLNSGLKWKTVIVEVVNMLVLMFLVDGGAAAVAVDDGEEEEEKEALGNNNEEVDNDEEDDDANASAAASADDDDGDNCSDYGVWWSTRYFKLTWLLLNLIIKFFFCKRPLLYITCLLWKVPIKQWFIQ